MPSQVTGPTHVRLPLGFRVRLDRRVRRLDDGAVLVGGAPPRLLRLAPTAQRRLSGGELVVDDATSAALARRLLDTGTAHPVPHRKRSGAAVRGLGPGHLTPDPAGDGRRATSESSPGPDEMGNSHGRDAELAGVGCGTRGGGVGVIGLRSSSGGSRRGGRLCRVPGGARSGRSRRAGTGRAAPGRSGRGCGRAACSGRRWRRG